VRIRVEAPESVHERLRDELPRVLGEEHEFLGFAATDLRYPETTVILSRVPCGPSANRGDMAELDSLRECLGEWLGVVPSASYARPLLEDSSILCINPDDLPEAAEGSWSTWEDLEGDPQIVPGATVILGRHREVGGADNWHSAMDVQVGEGATVTDPAHPQQGCRCVLVDVWGGYRWRVRDMVYVSGPEEEEDGDPLVRFILQNLSHSGWASYQDIEQTVLAQPEFGGFDDGTISGVLRELVAEGRVERRLVSGRAGWDEFRLSSIIHETRQESEQDEEPDDLPSYATCNGCIGLRHVGVEGEGSWSECLRTPTHGVGFDARPVCFTSFEVEDSRGEFPHHQLCRGCVNYVWVADQRDADEEPGFHCSTGQSGVIVGNAGPPCLTLIGNDEETAVYHVTNRHLLGGLRSQHVYDALARRAQGENSTILGLMTDLQQTGIEWHGEPSDSQLADVISALLERWERDSVVSRTYIGNVGQVWTLIPDIRWEWDGMEHEQPARETADRLTEPREEQTAGERRFEAATEYLREATRDALRRACQLKDSDCASIQEVSLQWSHLNSGFNMDEEMQLNTIRIELERLVEAGEVERNAEDEFRFSSQDGEDEHQPVHSLIFQALDRASGLNAPNRGWSAVDSIIREYLSVTGWVAEPQDFQVALVERALVTLTEQGVVESRDVPDFSQGFAGHRTEYRRAVVEPTAEDGAPQLLAFISAEEWRSGDEVYRRFTDEFPCWSGDEAQRTTIHAIHLQHLVENGQVAVRVQDGPIRYPEYRLTPQLAQRMEHFYDARNTLLPLGVTAREVYDVLRSAPAASISSLGIAEIIRSSRPATHLAAAISHLLEMWLRDGVVDVAVDPLGGHAVNRCYSLTEGTVFIWDDRDNWPTNPQEGNTYFDYNSATTYRYTGANWEPVFVVEAGGAAGNQVFVRPEPFCHGVLTTSDLYNVLTHRPQSVAVISIALQALRQVTITDIGTIARYTIDQLAAWQDMGILLRSNFVMPDTNEHCFQLNPDVTLVWMDESEETAGRTYSARNRMLSGGFRTHEVYTALAHESHRTLPQLIHAMRDAMGSDTDGQLRESLDEVLRSWRQDGVVEVIENAENEPYTYGLVEGVTWNWLPEEQPEQPELPIREVLGHIEYISAEEATREVANVLGWSCDNATDVLFPGVAEGLVQLVTDGVADVTGASGEEGFRLAEPPSRMFDVTINEAVRNRLADGQWHSTDDFVRAAGGFGGSDEERDARIQAVREMLSRLLASEQVLYRSAGTIEEYRLPQEEAVPQEPETAEDRLREFFDREFPSGLDNANILLYRTPSPGFPVGGYVATYVQEITQVDVERWGRGTYQVVARNVLGEVIATLDGVVVVENLERHTTTELTPRVVWELLEGALVDDNGTLLRGSLGAAIDRLGFVVREGTPRHYIDACLNRWNDAGFVRHMLNPQGERIGYQIRRDTGWETVEAFESQREQVNQEQRLKSGEKDVMTAEKVEVLRRLYKTLNRSWEFSGGIADEDLMREYVDDHDPDGAECVRLLETETFQLTNEDPPVTITHLRTSCRRELGRYENPQPAEEPKFSINPSPRLQAQIDRGELLGILHAVVEDCIGRVPNGTPTGTMVADNFLKLCGFVAHAHVSIGTSVRWNASVLKHIENLLQQDYPLAHAVCASWHPSRHLVAAGMQDGKVALLEWHAESQLLERVETWETQEAKSIARICWSGSDDHAYISAWSRGGVTVTVEPSSSQVRRVQGLPNEHLFVPTLVSHDEKFELEHWDGMGMRVVRRGN